MKYLRTNITYDNAVEITEQHELIAILDDNSIFIGPLNKKTYTGYILWMPFNDFYNYYNDTNYQPENYQFTSFNAGKDDITYDVNITSREDMVPAFVILPEKFINDADTVSWTSPTYDNDDNVVHITLEMPAQIYTSTQDLINSGIFNKIMASIMLQMLKMQGYSQDDIIALCQEILTSNGYSENQISAMDFKELTTAALPLMIPSNIISDPEFIEQMSSMLYRNTNILAQNNNIHDITTAGGYYFSMGETNGLTTIYWDFFHDNLITTYKMKNNKEFSLIFNIDNNIPQAN